jgi:catechol 2,3-dioxygenase-like lactoylglutathione lyase family enzyme
MIKPTGVSHVAMVTADLDRYRAFYENVVGLDTALVLGPSSDIGRHAIFFAGDTAFTVFEVVDYDPAAHGIGSAMFERGRLDHLGFAVPDEAALGEVRDRLVAAGASSGDIHPLGPTLSVRYQDPDGFEGEVNCLNPDFEPSAFGGDEVVDPGWYERARRQLRAGVDP